MPLIYHSGWSSRVSEPGWPNAFCAVIVGNLIQGPVNIGVELLFGRHVRRGSRTLEAEKSVKNGGLTDSCAEPLILATHLRSGIQCLWKRSLLLVARRLASRVYTSPIRGFGMFCELLSWIRPATSRSSRSW